MVWQLLQNFMVSAPLKLWSKFYITAVTFMVKKFKLKFVHLKCALWHWRYCKNLKLMVFCIELKSVKNVSIGLVVTLMELKNLIAKCQHLFIDRMSHRLHDSGKIVHCGMAANGRNNKVVNDCIGTAVTFLAKNLKFKIRLWNSNRICSFEDCALWYGRYCKNLMVFCSIELKSVKNVSIGLVVTLMV